MNESEKEQGRQTFSILVSVCVGVLALVIIVLYYLILRGRWKASRQVRPGIPFQGRLV